MSMGDNDSFEPSTANGNEMNWQRALVYTAGALLLLLVGFVGNGVLG